MTRLLGFGLRNVHFPVEEGASCGSRLVRCCEKNGCAAAYSYAQFQSSESEEMICK